MQMYGMNSPCLGSVPNIWQKGLLLVHCVALTIRKICERITRSACTQTGLLDFIQLDSKTGCNASYETYLLRRRIQFVSNPELVALQPVINVNYRPILGVPRLMKVYDVLHEYLLHKITYIVI